MQRIKAGHTREFDTRTGKRLTDLALKDELIIFIRRGGETMIPSGDTVLRMGDLLYVVEKQSQPEKSRQGRKP